LQPGPDAKTSSATAAAVQGVKITGRRRLPVGEKMLIIIGSRTRILEKLSRPFSHNTGPEFQSSG
jgi:hypothetical protein